MLVVGFITLALTAVCVSGQFVDRTTQEVNIQRILVEDKTCTTITGITFSTFVRVVTDPATGVTSNVIMVDRSKMRRVDSAGNTISDEDCAPGSLFSLNPILCQCSDFAANNPAVVRASRCLISNMDFLGQTGQFASTRQFTNGTNFASTVYVSRPLPGLDRSCALTNTAGFISIPFFQGNEIATATFDFTIGFHIPSVLTTGDNAYRIVSNGPCTGVAAANFQVVYVPGATPTIQWTFAVGDRFTTGTSITLTCTITPRLQDGNQAGPTVTFDPTATDTVLTLRGNPSTPGSFTMILRNGASPGNIFDTGFCSNSFTSVTVSGEHVVGTDCPLYLGQAPSGSNMCIRNLNVNRDCS